MTSPASAGEDCEPPHAAPRARARRSVDRRQLGASGRFIGPLLSIAGRAARTSAARIDLTRAPARPDHGTSMKKAPCPCGESGTVSRHCSKRWNLTVHCPALSKRTGPTWYVPGGDSVVCWFEFGAGCVVSRNTSGSTFAPTAGAPSAFFVAVTVKLTSLFSYTGETVNFTWYLQSSSSPSELYIVSPKPVAPEPLTLQSA